MTRDGSTALERRAAPPAAPDIRQDPLALGKVLAASGYFRDARDVNQAIVKVVAGMELGFGSLAAMTGIHLIEGKPVIGANLMATLVKRSKRYEYRVKELSDKVCTLEFYERGPDGWQLSGESTFTWTDASTAGLTSKNNYKHHPRNMLFARSLSNGIKWYAPDLTAGSTVYTPDELDVTIDEDVGEVAPDIPPASLPVSVAEQRAEPEAQAQEPSEPLITAAQKRKFFAELDKAEIKDDEPRWRALMGWVTAKGHLDRVTKQQAGELIDSVADHEGVLATIFDAAADPNADRHDVAKAIVARHYPDHAGGGEQQELT